MRSERMCALGRELANECQPANQTYAAQWVCGTPLAFLNDSSLNMMAV